MDFPISIVNNNTISFSFTNFISRVQELLLHFMRFTIVPALIYSVAHTCKTIFKDGQASQLLNDER